LPGAVGKKLCAAISVDFRRLGRAAAMTQHPTRRQPKNVLGLRFA
jgi:hypothetical protein